MKWVLVLLAVVPRPSEGSHCEEATTFCCKDTFSLFGGLSFEWEEEEDKCCRGPYPDGITPGSTSYCSYRHGSRYHLYFWEDRYYFTSDDDCTGGELAVVGGFSASLDEIIAACPTSVPSPMPTNPTATPTFTKTVAPSTPEPTGIPAAVPTPMPSTLTPTIFCDTPAPKIQSAQFSRSGGTILVLFDSDTDRATFGSKSFTCSEAGLSSQRNGQDLDWADATCRFTTDLALQVEGSLTLLPGDDIVLAYDTLIQPKGKSECRRDPKDNLEATSLIRIEAPSEALVPQVILSGPEVVSAVCSEDGLSVDARASTGGGGRSLNFQWQAYYIDTEDGQINSRSDLKSVDLDFSHASGGVNNVATVTEASLIQVAGRQLVVTATATNFLGFSSAQVISQISVTADPVPLVQIDGGAILDAATNQLVIQQARASATDVRVAATFCGQQSGLAVPANATTLNCRWQFTSAETGEVVQNQGRDKRQFYLAPYTLPAPYFGTLRVECQDTSTGFESHAETGLAVITSDIIVRVLGGDRRVVSLADSERVTIEVRAVDPDQNPADTTNEDTFEYVWTCISEDCPAALLTAIEEAQNNAILSFEAIDAGLGTFDFEVQVSTTSTNPSTRTAAVTIVVVDSIVPRLGILCGEDGVSKPSPSEPLVCEGSIESGSTQYDVQYEFVLTSGELNDASTLDDTALTSTSATLARTTQSTIAYLALPANALASGSAYSFELRAYYILENDDLITTATAVAAVNTNAAPSSGSLTVSPLEGETPNDVFDIEAMDWVDDPEDLPLTYAFFHLDAFGSSPGVEYSLRAAARSPTYSDAILPRGTRAKNFTVTLQVRVADSLGAATNSRTNVVVTSPPADEAAALAEKETESWLGYALASDNFERAMQILVLSSGFLSANQVNCSKATDDYCQARNREVCGDAGDQECGGCLDGHRPDTTSTMKNAACRAINYDDLPRRCSNGVHEAFFGETDVDCGGDNCAPCDDGLECEIDADCTYDHCDDVTKRCEALEKTCEGGCSEDIDDSSICVLIDPSTLLPYTDGVCNEAVSDTLCIASCACGPDRFGDKCQFDGEAWQARLQLQTSMFAGLGSVTAAQVANSENAAAQAATLAAQTNGNVALEDDTAAYNALLVANTLTGSAAEEGARGSFAPALVDSMSSIIANRKKRNSTTTNATARSEINNLLASAIDGLSGSMLVGKVPNQESDVVESDSLRLSSRRVDTGGDFELPASTIDGTKPSVSLPSSCVPDGSDVDAVVAEYGVNPFDSFQAEAGGSSIANSSGLFATEVDEENEESVVVNSKVLRFSAHASSVDVMTGRRVRRRLQASDCSSSSVTSEDGQEETSDGVSFTLPVSGARSGSSNGSETVTLTCRAFIDENGTTYSASLASCGAGNENISLTCDGVTDKELVVNCESSVTPSCVRQVNGVWDESACEVVEASASATICKCSADAALDPEGNEYASRSGAAIYRKYLKESFDRPLSEDLINRNSLLLTVLGVVIGFFVVAAAIGRLLDHRDSEVRLEKIRLIWEARVNGDPTFTVPVVGGAGAPPNAEGADNRNEGEIAENDVIVNYTDDDILLNADSDLPGESLSSSENISQEEDMVFDEKEEEASQDIAVEQEEVTTAADARNATLKKRPSILRKTLPPSHRNLLQELDQALPQAPVFAQGQRLQKLESKLLLSGAEVKPTKVDAGSALVTSHATSRSFGNSASGEDARKANFTRHQLLLASAMPHAVEKNPMVREKLREDHKLHCGDDQFGEEVMRDSLDANAGHIVELEIRPSLVGPRKKRLSPVSRIFRCVHHWWLFAKVAGRHNLTDHTLLSIFYVYNPRRPRPLRCFIACIDVVMILFAETVALWYTNPVGICEQQKIESNCDNVMSTTSLVPRRLCIWEYDNEEPCQVRDPNATQEQTEDIWEAFICVLVALPLIKLFEFVFTNYIEAPLLTKEAAQEIADDDDDISGQHSNSAHSLEQNNEIELSTVNESVNEDDVADDDSDEGVKQAPHPKLRVERELGLLLLHNLGVVDDSDPNHFFGRRAILGYDGLPTESTKLPDQEKREIVSTREELLDWFALRATGAAMRAVLLRRQELRDALKDLMDSGSTDDDDLLEDGAICETVDFNRRKKVINLLAQRLESHWNCPPVNLAKAAKEHQAAKRKALLKRQEKRRRTSYIHAPPPETFNGPSSNNQNETKYDELVDSNSIHMSSMTAVEKRRVTRYYRKFAKRVFENLRDNLEVAVQFHCRHGDAHEIVGKSSLQQARMIYQLMFLEFFDNEVERRVYQRLLQIDDERELRHPSSPVTRTAKIIAWCALFVLCIIPIWFMLTFGMNMGAAEMRNWLKTIMMAGFLILFIIEPIQIIFTNIFLPKLLVPKMAHFHDPCQIIPPFRTPLSVAPVDIVPARDLAAGFTAGYVPIPKRLALAAAARRQVTQEAVNAPVVTSAPVFRDPFVIHHSSEHNSASTCCPTFFKKRAMRKKLKRIALSAVEALHASNVDPDHRESNRSHRLANPALWSDESIFRLEAGLDWRPPRNYGAAIVLFGILTSFSNEVEDIVLEESINFLISFAGTAAALMGTDSSALIWILTVFFCGVIVAAIYYLAIFIMAIVHALTRKPESLEEVLNASKQQRAIPVSGSSGDGQDLPEYPSSSTYHNSGGGLKRGSASVLETLHTPTDYFNNSK